MGYAWGMVINLNACIGCSACVTACQAENNIPVVGRTRCWPRDALDPRRPVLHGDDSNNPDDRTSPGPACTARTPRARWSARWRDGAHAEGINKMVYNRCVGTRYCWNNCPYKVRQFNFLQYSDQTTPEPEAAAQPRRDRAAARRDGEVHVLRPADQRARITAEIEGRPVSDDEVVTACQAACPTQAIVFGDLNDKDSRCRS